MLMTNCSGLDWRSHRTHQVASGQLVSLQWIFRGNLTEHIRWLQVSQYHCSGFDWKSHRTHQVASGQPVSLQWIWLEISQETSGRFRSAGIIAVDLIGISQDKSGGFRSGGIIAVDLIGDLIGHIRWLQVSRYHCSRFDWKSHRTHQVALGQAISLQWIWLKVTWYTSDGFRSAGIIAVDLMENLIRHMRWLQVCLYHCSGFEWRSHRTH